MDETVGRGPDGHAASDSEPDERVSVAVLAARLADDMDFIPLFDWVYPQFVAARVGCLTFPQPYPFLDVVSACLD